MVKKRPSTEGVNGRWLVEVWVCGVLGMGLVTMFKMLVNLKPTQARPSGGGRMAAPRPPRPVCHQPQPSGYFIAPVPLTT
ncbi:hypothetical protein E2C01_004591 [Portunus trituberculatus]|uniref:Uncharacterized protein n=1 Tax=Portunus trituberculatus TaxID=210409 RepID=A0A5B7CUD5_PORTR|nr:hypothetical protein [Portunus trituberculatus]